MTAYAREHSGNLYELENSISYSMLLPSDFSFVLMKNYLIMEEGMKERLIKIPAFTRWLNTKGKYLNGN